MAYGRIYKKPSVRRGVTRRRYTRPRTYSRVATRRVRGVYSRRYRR